MIQKPVIQSLILVILALSIVGCGPGRREKVETAPVAGTVKLDGQPLEGAEINFLGAEYAGVATTDAAGHYELEAQPGENTIYVSKYKGDNLDPDFDETMLDEGDMPGGGPEQLLPKKFSDPEASELGFTVPDDGSTDANFELTSR